VFAPLLFYVIFRYISEKRISRKVSFLAALTYTVLFETAKYGVGLYLGYAFTSYRYYYQGYTVPVIIGIWVFYSAVLFVLTAAMARAYQDIDGVIIATPDHWHTYIFAEACKAGKAIYIEKPVGHTVSDCELMVDLQRKHNNVVQTGLWQISLDYFKDAFDILRSGVLGDVYKVHAFITGGTNPATFEMPQTVPDTLDYDMWTGPAPKHPYANEKIQNWRRFWDYGGGGQTDWVHYLDSALDGMSALGHKRTYPKSIYSSGYKHPDTMYDVPSLQTSIFQFDDYQVVWEQQVSNLYNRSDGVAWIGSNGTLVCNRTGYEVIPQTSDGRPVIAEVRMQGSYGNQYNHMINWANCIRENNPDTNSPIDKGSYASLLAAIANISHRMDSQSLEYLHEEKKFRDNPEADNYLVNEYQNHWEYPTL
jgi:predicted dehydrogenase